MLENVHAATTSQLLKKHPILRSLSREDQDKVRVMVIKMILGTDMAHHFDGVARFRDLINTRRSKLEKGEDTTYSFEERMLIMKTIVHLSDLGGPTKPWNL